MTPPAFSSCTQCGRARDPRLTGSVCARCLLHGAIDDPPEGGDFLAAGYRLGPYELVMPIGAGGMGVVYRARDIRLGRDVALKTLPPHVAVDAAARRAFEHEARILAGLNHPH